MCAPIASPGLALLFRDECDVTSESSRIAIPVTASKTALTSLSPSGFCIIGGAALSPIALVLGSTNSMSIEIGPDIGESNTSRAFAPTASLHGFTFLLDSTITTRPPRMKPDLLPCGAGVPSTKKLGRSLTAD